MTHYPPQSMSNEEQNQVMSPAYRQLWNDDLQKKIDRDIEANRKADAVISLLDLPPDTEVKVEQISHDFIFGAHIFNFDQLGSDERNRRYRELFGELFNSATIAFYWKKFEMEEGSPRLKGEFRDTAEYWNNVAEPKKEPHWRRPASDPVVEFCESRKIRLHGHPLTWGNQCWHFPDWLWNKLPPDVLAKAQMKSKDARDTSFFDAFSAEQLEKLLPEFTSGINMQMAKRITDLALYYKERIHSWDVVNESATDYSLGRMHPNSGLCKSVYGLMPGDYTYRSFKIADGCFSKNTKLNINDYNLGQCYVDQIKDLRERGCKIDIMGAQMHLFNPQLCMNIANGTDDAAQKPHDVLNTMKLLSQCNLPIHLSEITITSPEDSLRGQAIQAVIARNLYRLWFSVKNMMGITWWNVVNDCGAPGEPSCSGIFSRDMEPLLGYYALDELINHTWRTNCCARTDSSGVLAFRGFRGDYRLTWRDGQSAIVHLK